MSELKHQLMLNRERSWVPCYLKYEADKIIAEKDAEIRRLQRALWLARAMRNKDLRTIGNMRRYVESLTTFKHSIYSYPKQGFPANYLHKRMMDSFEAWCKSFKIAEIKCRNKAEEYK